MKKNVEAKRLQQFILTLNIIKSHQFWLTFTTAKNVPQIMHNSSNLFSPTTACVR